MNLLSDGSAAEPGPFAGELGHLHRGLLGRVLHPPRLAELAHPVVRRRVVLHPPVVPGVWGGARGREDKGGMEGRKEERKERGKEGKREGGEEGRREGRREGGGHSIR